MKYFLIIVLALILTISLVGCRVDDLPFLNKDTQTLVENEEIKYKIDKVILSKGYQSIEPNVEVVKKSNDIRLLVSIGLLETSGISVDQIVKKGNIINIHVINELEENEIQLAVPQIILDLKNAKSLNLEEVKFNIVNENYKPLNIKFGVNEVINKVKLDFNVTSNSAPTIGLSSIDDSLIWNITYNSIFDMDNPETPLVNLSVELDANSGKVLKSTKGFISSFIDEGHVLDYVMDKFILYKQIGKEFESDIKTESVWYYDIKKNAKTLIYHTNSDIFSACFSQDYKYISVLEKNMSKASVYIISTDEKKAYKLLLEEAINPTLLRWNDKNDLFVLDNNGKTTNIYNYNIRNDETELISTIDKSIIDLRVNKGSYLLLQNDENRANKSIYFTKDWNNYRFIDFGFSLRLINEDIIGYLKKNEKDDTNLLHIYDIKNNEEYDVVGLNISSISTLPNNEIFIVEKNQGNNDFTLYEYEVENKILTPLTNVNSDKIFYNKEKNLIYVDLVVPFESSKTEIIYSVDLSKLVNPLP